MSPEEVFKNLERKPFLPAQEVDGGFTGSSISATHQRSRRRLYQIYSIHLALIVLYTLASALVIRWNNHHCIKPKTGRPHRERRRYLLTCSLVLADLTINYALKNYMTMHESPYVGPPDPNVDHAWSDLMANMSIRVTKSELTQNNQTSVRLPGGGYLAWLGVFHQLHCTVSFSTTLKPPNNLRSVITNERRAGALCV